MLSSFRIKSCIVFKYSRLGLIKEKSSAAEESRKAVESVARHLLDRLESEKNICENSLGPWQNR